MSIHPIESRPSADEPAVHDPRLRELVDAAAAQPVPTLGFDETALHAAWRDQRRRRRRAIGGGLAAAASVALIVSALLGTWSGPTAPVSVDRADAVARSTPPADPSASDSVSESSLEPKEPAPVRLAGAIDVRSLDERPGAPEILGPRRIRLPVGRWSVDSRAADPVELVLKDGTVRLLGAHVRVEIAADVARVEVLRGEIERFDREGQPVAEPSEPPERAERDATRPPGPDALARDADAHMEAGRLRLAIKSLRRLVAQHPRASATPAGLIDLGRLLERVGRVDDARCAYALFLARWPQHPLSGDITRARGALGDGPQCRGLRPLR